jgi:hypothetical protein
LIALFVISVGVLTLTSSLGAANQTRVTAQLFERMASEADRLVADQVVRLHDTGDVALCSPASVTPVTDDVGGYKLQTRVTMDRVTVNPQDLSLSTTPVCGPGAPSGVAPPAFSDVLIRTDSSLASDSARAAGATFDLNRDTSTNLRRYVAQRQPSAPVFDLDYQYIQNAAGQLEVWVDATVVRGGLIRDVRLESFESNGAWKVQDANDNAALPTNVVRVRLSPADPPRRVYITMTSVFGHNTQRVFIGCPSDPDLRPLALRCNDGDV